MIKSPFSSKPPEKVRELPRDLLLRELSHYFGSQPPPGVVECDYSLWRCPETGFEFAVPPCAGNRLFYEWISSFPTYYPAFRWEYGKVRDILLEQAGSAKSPVCLLDVGCGSGEFLENLADIPNVMGFGVDMNLSAVESCSKRGVKAFCGTIAEALRSGAFQPGQYDCVTSFHCLEHVPDPVGFIGEMLPLLNRNGRILVSTPYSPMSFETDWFDVMNHPPHHLGRWNISSYRHLAKLLGLNVRFHFPKARSAFFRALHSFRLIHLGVHRHINKVVLIGLILRRLPSFLQLWRRQCGRQTIDGATSADVILVELRRE